MNAELEREVIGIRNCMVMAAQTTPIPDRFKVSSGPLDSQRTITDKKTGKSVVIALCDYHGARRLLNALFG